MAWHGWQHFCVVDEMIDEMIGCIAFAFRKGLLRDTHCSFALCFDALWFIGGGWRGGRDGAMFISGYLYGRANEGWWVVHG